MADSSFDIVSEVDKQEADNALNQAAKEVAQRFDFKNTGTTIEWKSDMVVEITSGTEERALAALDVLKDKVVKRGISLKALDHGEPRSSGKEYKINGTFKSGISTEQAKKLSKLIRDEGPQGCQDSGARRRTPRHPQESRRAPGSDRTSQGCGPGLRSPVRQLSLEVPSSQLDSR